MRAEVSGPANSGYPVGKLPAYSRYSPTIKTLEPRKAPFRHPSRIQSSVTIEMREIGLTMHEILALADIMREAYGNGDMESLRHRLPLLISKAAGLESALSNIIEQTNCAHPEVVHKDK